MGRGSGGNNNNGAVEEDIGTGPSGVCFPLTENITSVFDTILPRRYSRLAVGQMPNVQGAKKQEILYIWYGDVQSYFGIEQKY